MTFNRVFCMPRPDTFKLKPVSDLMDRVLAGREVVVDPFAGNSLRGTLRNDIRPDTAAQSHVSAEAFMQGLVESHVRADGVLFDPPYSPRQITECYRAIGRKATMEDTQNGRMGSRVKDLMAALCKPGSIAVCCGWNSMGMGLNRGFEMTAILMVAHGGTHNDTIVTVEIYRGGS